jgi:hypothetical protein
MTESAPRNLRMNVTVTSNVFADFHSKKDNMDNVTHNWGPDSYFEEVLPKLAGKGDLYCAIRCDKVVCYSKIYTVFAKRGSQEIISEGDDVVMFPATTYLWHYNYDGNASNVKCDVPSVNASNLQYIKTFPESRTMRKRISWYLKPTSFFFLDSKDCTKVKWSSLMDQQGSSKRMGSRNRVCFGPIMESYATDFDYGSFRFLINNEYVYTFSFVCRRS